MSRIEEFLREDIGYGDITSEALIGAQIGAARLFSREECAVAGLEEAEEVFNTLGLWTAALVKDGESVLPGTEVLYVEGSLRSILSGERLALNFLMQMSGIATATRNVLWACRKRNLAIIIAATRKTTPGFRSYQKKAVALGGGDPHRNRLDDAVLIKDNHLAVVGSITEAVRMAKLVSFTKKVEVEVVSLAGAEEAAGAGADIILLDNMTPEGAKECSVVIKAIDPRILVEASGGITPDTAPAYAEAVDIISLGWLTHSSRAIDFSLDITEIKK
jgi:nicotinate-nucleotide pyrophosphorylase (carboxylating)